jgi:polyisoprenoid-binding protein YceI
MTTTTQAIAPEATDVPAGNWDIDPVHSTIGFEVKHLGISTFRGRFNGFEGVIDAGESGIEAVRGEISAASIDVNDPQLSGHLQSEDFFHSEAHPKLRFNSTSVERNDDGAYRVTGELEMRGVSHPIELDVRVDGVSLDPEMGDRISLVAEGVVDRTAYGMTWNSTLANGLPVLAENVRLVLTVEATRRSK